MDTIFIRGLVFSGKHGVFDEEHARPQRFGIDIEVKQKPADWGEKIKNTYNYMDAREIARVCIEEKSFKLIETLAETICQEILMHPLAESVSVTIRKLDVLPVGEVGVTLVRSLT